jgi:hypothetical protein
MPNPELRFTGFKDPTGLDIFEGDYLVIKLSDLSPEQIEKRQLGKLMEQYDIQYMQAYIKPTGQLRYDIEITFVDSNHQALTDVKYYFSREKGDMSEEEFFADYGKSSSLDEVYTVLVMAQFQMFKGIIKDNLWFKVPALHVMESK